MQCYYQHDYLLLASELLTSMYAAIVISNCYLHEIDTSKCVLQKNLVKPDVIHDSDHAHIDKIILTTRNEHTHY